MATEVVMPQMGESIAEGTITKWLVKIGETVTRDQPLFEISTDKVDAEIPSPSAGTLLEIKHQEGETVPVNEVVAVIGEAGAQSAGAQSAGGQSAGAQSAGAQPAGTAAEPAKPAAPAAEPAQPAAAAGKTDSSRAAAQPAPSDAREEAAGEEAGREGLPASARQPLAAVSQPAGGDGRGDEQEDIAAGAPAGEESEGERLRKFSSPLVRSIAAKEGVDLSEVEGTGAHGRVTKNDILSYLDQRRAAPDAAPTAAAPASATAARPAPATAPAPAAPAQRPTGGFSVPAYVEGENVEIEPMSRIRQLTAAHMVYSKATSAHVTTVFHIDMSRVARMRARAKDGFAQKEGTKLTYMPFIFKAVINALKAYKKLNATIDGTNIVYKKDINLGIAVDLGYGLIVPVIKHADQLSLVGLAKTANDLAERARAKKLKPEEVQGGTFTITNPGVFGSLWGSPIINQPQVAILGIGAVEKRPVVTTDDNGNDALAIRTMCYFSITYDHRLVDGADADRFMIEVKRTLEQDTWTELDAYL
ncbi:MAG TPA: dihydrolipoamide acetyltransferase family protein [Thermoanaerobaculia bacterium]|nr:dihydrolipoamide acetyltransferase family protein [Thermoanaerobaculia bacterium]